MEHSFYCPGCERQGIQNVELVRGQPEMHLFRCAIGGHAYTYEQLRTLGAKMVQTAVAYTPPPAYVKGHVFLPPELWAKFCQKYPQQTSPTLESILSLLLDDDLILISGAQARELKKLGVKTGADMVETAKSNQTLTATNEDLVRENSRFYQAIAEHANA